jgi:hypothetical protein
MAIDGCRYLGETDLHLHQHTLQARIRVLANLRDPPPPADFKIRRRRLRSPVTSAGIGQRGAVGSAERGARQGATGSGDLGLASEDLGAGSEHGRGRIWGRVTDGIGSDWTQSIQRREGQQCPYEISYTPSDGPVAMERRIWYFYSWWQIAMAYFQYVK